MHSVAVFSMNNNKVSFYSGSSSQRSFSLKCLALGEKNIKIEASKAPKLKCDMERGDWHEIQQSMAKETRSKTIRV